MRISPTVNYRGARRRRRARRAGLRRRRPAPRAAPARRPLGAELPLARDLQERAAGRRGRHRAHTVWIGDVLIRKAAEGTDTFELNRNLRAHRARPRRLGAEPGDRDRRDRRRRPRQRHRPVRRRAAVLPAEPRHPRGRARRLVVRGFFGEILQQDPRARAARAARGGHRGRARRRPASEPTRPTTTGALERACPPWRSRTCTSRSRPRTVPRRSCKGVDLTVELRTRPTRSWARTAPASRRWPTRSPGHPKYDGHPGQVTARRRGRAGDDRRRARPRRPVPRDAVPGRGARRLDGELPALAPPPPSAARRRSCGTWVKEVKGAMTDLDIDPAFAERSVNEGFSGGEKKRHEVLQLALLKPKIAVLDETDSGLDVDALRVVSARASTTTRRRRRRRPADHALHPDPAAHHARRRARVRGRPGRRVRRPRAGRRAGEERLRAVRGLRRRQAEQPA